MTTLQSDPISATFAALADPTRRAIVERLAEGDATLTELSQPFPMSMQAIARHLKVLERAGLVSRGRVAQERPAHLEEASFAAAAGWFFRYREFWEESFDRLEELLRSTQPNRVASPFEVQQNQEEPS